MAERIYPAGPGYERFKKDLARLTGIDLDIYKYQIHRRVHTLMNNWGHTDYGEFFRAISSDDVKLGNFLNYITINVTEFFRNPARWDSLREDVLPELRRMYRGSLDFLSAGCSTGEEPYSLAMVARIERIPCRIIALDLDEGALRRAEEGRYREKQIAAVPDDLREASFTSEGDGFFRVRPELKEMVTFKKANLLEQELPSGQHLIFCRNVVIYFSAETKIMLYEKFYKSLADGGFLMVGTTEQIFEYSRIGFEQAGPFLYRKPSGRVLSK
ncbi:MAG TPA: protein-glutamate O-methyltransferase CheR [Thermovirgaceae bacterium]|nr:protein-glutamate O-methyltransferase CheR [Thermovirgaceae bacterium]